MDEKRCSRCGETKPVSQFHKTWNGGHRALCRSCTLGLPTSADSRVCTICGTAKLVSEFYLASRGSAPMSRCKECWRDRQKRLHQRRAARDHIALPETVTCYTCKRELPVSMFARNRTQARGVQGRCFDCHRDKRHGLRPGQYDALLEAQNGVCAICQASVDKFVVDHDHECCPDGGKSCGSCVRGLLCAPCNWVLGAARDNIKTLLAAVEYLEGGGGSRHG